MSEHKSPGLKLFKAGYTDLVCVAPPGVTVSPNSGLNPKDLGKRPGKKGTRGWYGYGWLTDEPTVEDVKRWVEWGANLGLRGTRFPALDIDSSDPKLTAVIQKLALDNLGWAPSRVGKAPKTLLVYRTDEPFSRVAIEIDHGRKTHLVEFLGHGRQYLVYGKHPEGDTYLWQDSKKLWDVSQDALTPITGEGAEQFLTVVEEKLTGVGLVVRRVGRASAISKSSVPQHSLRAPSVDALVDAVANVANDARFSQRDDYIQMGCAVKAAAGEHEEEGYLIFSTWASRWEDGTNDPEVVRGDWRRMHAPFRVGYQWIVEQAGDSYNNAVWEFDADPAAEPPAVEIRRLKEPFPVDCTDDWLSEQIAPELRPSLCYDYPNGRWHRWDGTRWAYDDCGLHVRAVTMALRRLARDLRARIAALSSKERERYGRTINKLGNVSTLNAVITLLEGMLAVGVDAFDTEDMELNTPAGTVDLTTGVMKDHDPKGMHSKLTAVSPGAIQAPVWVKFLKEVTRGDEGLARFLQKSAGYALTGIRREQTLNFLWGPGGNGKSVFIDAIMAVMGEYAATAPMDTFASSKGDKHPTDLAGLMGARLVTASETQSGRSWDEQRLKAITGGDRMRARFMRQDFVEFTPRFKLLLVGNHEPQLGNVDDAMRRRIHIVPFVFQPRVPDLQLPEKLKEEYPAILRWMIEGCLMWQTEGLEPPECVLVRTGEYFEEEDLPGQWLRECCVLTTAATMTSADAYRSWQIWCNLRGEHAGTRKAFTKLIRAHEAKMPFAKAQLGESRLRGWRGIRLIENPSDIQGEIA
jgi:P4 family phage/plasmid primase-like protien